MHNEAAKIAADFITPALQRGSGTDASDELETLAGPTGALKIGPGEDPNRHVVRKALQLLLEFHREKCEEEKGAESKDVTYDGAEVGTVYGLVDLIVFRGILSSLSEGASFPVRPKPVLVPSALSNTQRDMTLLSEVIDGFKEVLSSCDQGLEPWVNQRALPDVISGLAELGYSPASTDALRQKYAPRYESTLDGIPTIRLVPILTNYRQPGTPPWLRPRLSKPLSLLPLRPRGVRTIIEWISLSHGSSKSHEGAASDIAVSSEAIKQATKLLSSVPSTMMPEEWYSALAPQLWAMLDGDDGPEFSKAAAEIVGGGILGRRAVGEPGKIGWTLFAEPLLGSVNPDLDPRMVKFVSKSDAGKGTSMGTIIPEQRLSSALSRLTALVMSHPNPGLIKRLLSPVILPLWGLLAYSTSRSGGTRLSAKWKGWPLALLSKYFAISLHVENINRVASNLAYSGGELWVFAPGDAGGVEIRLRYAVDDNGLGVLGQIADLESNVATFVELLTRSNLDGETSGKVFLGVARRWMESGDTRRGYSKTLESWPDADPMTMLASAKLFEALIGMSKKKLMGQPMHIVEFVGQMMNSIIGEEIRRDNGEDGSLYSSLGSIATPKQAAHSASSEAADSEDMLSVCLSLLSATLDTAEAADAPSFLPVNDALVYLSQPRERIVPSITQAAQRILKHLSTTPSLTSSAVAAAPLPPTDPLPPLLHDLTSPSPPTRTSALHSISALLTSAPPDHPLDLPLLTHAALHPLLHDPESYVYLAASATLSHLARASPRPVVRTLVDAWLDADEALLAASSAAPPTFSTTPSAASATHAADPVTPLDSRLRLAETLALTATTTLPALPPALAAPAQRLIVRAALALASRRGQRPQSLALRDLARRGQEGAREEVARAWGGEAPLDVARAVHGGGEEGEREEEEARVLEAWEDVGVEEDVRVRASAMGVLGAVLESGFLDAGGEVLGESLRTASAVLGAEPGPGKALVRRAAVRVVWAALKGLDARIEAGEIFGSGDEGELEELTLGLGLGVGTQPDDAWAGVQREVARAAAEDEDDLVRGHAVEVMEGIEAVRMKMVVRAAGAGWGGNPGLDEGGLRGLAVRPRVGEKGGRKPVVEVVED